MHAGGEQHASFVYKFTGKQRDSESGLDDFGARYDSTSMARFMLICPQSLRSESYDTCLA